jgi:hypothetical protein
MHKQWLTIIMTATILLNIMLLGCAFREPSISIEHIGIQGTTMSVEVSRASTGYYCDRVIILESDQLFDAATMVDIASRDLRVGAVIDNMLVIAESSPSQRKENVVASTGVKGVNIFNFDLSKMNFDHMKHYYVSATTTHYRVSSICIDDFVI